MKDFTEFDKAEEWFNNSEHGKGRIAGFVPILMVEYAKYFHEEKLKLLPIMLSLQELEKIKRIAWLKGVTEFTIWADCIPNGNEICDKYQEELKVLLSNEA